jgi:serine/threonine protein kinase/tetratricopeptide (TPR) repeat protein
MEPDNAHQADDLAPTETVTTTVLKGRYVLGSELGRGGFGITYLATDADVAMRKVVVKILNERRSGDVRHLKRFRGEMEALSRIDHPNVVGVLDYWESKDRQQFLVMQFVPGETLRQRIRRASLPLPTIGIIVSQIGRALTAAHDAGVIHRDVKPENIMIRATNDSGDQVKLIDFGVAAIRAPDDPSLSANVCGTFPYIAPEQFEGESSRASDIYQMGVVAYELVTGIVPFRAGSAGGVAIQQREGIKVMPRQLRADLPESGERAILRALSLNPKDRFHSAREFGEGLADVLEPGRSPPNDWMIRTPSEDTRTGIGRWNASRMIAAAILSVLAVTGYLVYRAQSPAAEFVAVLPFENHTGEPELAYLTAGVTESLIGDLSRIPTLRVSALGSVRKYEGRKPDIRAAGRELGATRIIDGSISKRDGGLFVDTELIDVRTGARTWGNAYSTNISSISEILRSFSIEVTDQLRLKLSGPLRDRLKRQYGVGSTSYETYLKARYALNKRTAADFDQAIRYFEEVVAADPDYAPARAGLAATYARMAIFGPFWSGTRPQDALERAKSAAQGALQLDGTLAEAYEALAMVELNADYKWEAAERDYLRSIDLNPNFGETHENYAMELAALGRSGEAVHEIDLAEKLEPDNSHFRAAHGLILYLGHRYDESLGVYRDIARTPEGARRVADIMAMDYWMKSMPGDAAKVLDSMPREFPELRIPFTITALCREGLMAQARTLHDSFYLHEGRAWWYHLAMAHLNMRRPEDAIRDLETAYQERWYEVIWIGVDPMLDELRSNPGFHRLLMAVKLATKPI